LLTERRPSKGLPVGMAVHARWTTVGSPASVCNASVRVEGLVEIWLGLVAELSQCSDLANLLESINLILLVTIDCQTSGIVATIF
jgi:hypothetical protein